MNNPDISIILPIYNQQNYILKSIKSILSQDFTNFELIILDDGSNDKSVDLISNLVDPRIKLVTDGKRLGLASRLNQGLLISKAKIIARMDADDISFPNRLSTQYKYLIENPSVDLIGSQILYFKKHTPLGITNSKISKNLFFNLLNGINIPHPTWMVKKNWFLKNMYFLPEFNLAEDQELLIRSYKNSNFLCLNEVLLAYRVYPNNLYKKIKKRIALMKVQNFYLLNNKKYFYLLFPILFFLIKLILDLYYYILSNKKFNSLRLKIIPKKILQTFNKINNYE